MEKEDLNELSKILYEQLFSCFPEWEQYAELFDSGHFDSKLRFVPNGKKRLYIEIPSPVNKDHYISITERGDCIEIAYSNGNPQKNAEQQIGGDDLETVEATIEFVEEILEEKILVGQERTFWGLGNKLCPMFFLTPAESQKKKFVNVYSWKGTFNRVNFLA